MALTVKDILELNVMKNITIVAGEKGLSRPVIGLGIGDYEFSSFTDKSERDVFEPSMAVLSNLLFAKNEPELITECVRFLSEIGAAALFFKPSVFVELPKEAIESANASDFPIIRYENTYMEEIIFEVLDALRAEEDDLFSEENIDLIMTKGLSREKLYSMVNGASLKMRNYIRVLYASSDDPSLFSAADRYLREVYLNRNLNSRSMLFKYKNGIFAVMTAQNDDPGSFNTILNMLKGYLNFDRFNNMQMSLSNVYDPYEGLDIAIREAYHTLLASLAEGNDFKEFNNIGLYRIILSLKDDGTLRDYVNAMMKPVLCNDDFLDTFTALVKCGGDISAASKMANCHHNTIRYRIHKTKEALGLSDITDQDFYSQMAFAIKSYLVQNSQLI